MSNYEESLDDLIGELGDFLNQRYVSSDADDFDGLGSIEQEYPDLYEAVQELEKLTGGKLPMGAWEHWNELLEISRQEGNDVRRARRACVAANNLLEWAKRERTAPTGERGPPQENLLSLEVDVALRTATRNGETAKFGAKDRAWTLFYCLHESGEAGMPRRTLIDAIWGDEAVEPNNLDQQKRAAEKILSVLGLRISSQGGNWRLAELIQPDV